MPKILCIETATEICSVAVVSEDGILALCENQEGNAHASQLTLLIEEACEEANLGLNQLNAVSVSKGPGSYTGLRVGVSTAKGLCYAINKPLIAVNTLEALTLTFLKQNEVSGICIPMLDARRMEVYCGKYDSIGNSISTTEAKVITTNSFAAELSTGKVYFFGSGAAKCVETVQHENAFFNTNIFCSAAGMLLPALSAFTKQHFENVAYFEPYYLKDFIGTNHIK